MDSDTDDITRINFKIRESQKRQWADYAEENGFGTLTHLIKTAVRSEMSDTWVLAGDMDVTLSTDDIEDALSDLVAQVEAMQSQLDDLQSPATRTDEQLTREELIVIANRAHDNLPVARHDDDMRLMVDAAHIHDKSRSVLTGTAADVAEEIGETPHATRQALIWLENEQHTRVTSFIDETGVRRWYEMDPDLDVSEYPDEVDYEAVFVDGSDIE